MARTTPTSPQSSTFYPAFTGWASPRISLSATKKGVDIVVVRDTGDAVTVEVKGIAKKYDWPVGNLTTKHPDQHFVALVSFEGRIDEADMPQPRIWVIPFPEVEQFKRYYKTRTNVSRAAIRADGGEFEDAWHLIAARSS